MRTLVQRLLAQLGASVTKQQIDELLAAFLASRAALGTAAKTQTWYDAQIGAYGDWCAGQGIGWPQWAEKHSIDQFLNHERGRGLSPASVAARFRALRAFLNWCEADGHIEKSALRGAPVPKVPKKEPKRVKPAEYQKLMASIPRQPWPWTNLRDRAIVAVLFTAGLRVGECTQLQVGDIDMGERLIHVRSGKTGARYVPLHPDAAAAVTEYLYNRPGQDAELWLSNDGAGNVRGPMTGSGIRQLLRRRCEDAGLRRLNPHSFRHGCATHMLNAGADMSLVQQVLGHSDAQMTAHYARWSTEGLQRAYQEAWRAHEDAKP